LTENEKLREQVAELTRAERTFENVSLRAAELERDGASLKARVHEVEALRDEEQKRGDALAADVARLTTDVARLTGELTALQKANAELQANASQVRDNEPTLILDRTLNDARRRISELEAQIAAMDPPTLRSKEMQAQRILALENQKAALEERERTLIAANKKHELEKAGLVGKHAAAEARAREAAEELAALRASPSPSPEALAAQETLRTQALALEEEVRRLEESLRERGRDIAKLTRDLRQTERVGRELLFELELTKSTAAGGGGGGGNGGGLSPEQKSELDAELRASAERLARTEADLYAAGWQIARLERELAEAKPEAGRERDPAHDLSVALAAAQREIASLRLSGFDRAMPGGVARAEILEQSVLMSQVEAGRGLDRR
ncbi:MAG: hypothetical protein JNK04_00515, partial [Myxococcales bacterium]|nr:hypothetical protein [Myxococcales bacterium]